jgi:hypothetical protein
VPDKFYSRPKDKSLQAYKDWITSVVNRINPDAEETMTESQWEEHWKEFWSKAEGVKDDLETSTTSDIAGTESSE